MAHILIVDDLPELRELLAFALAHCGHTVECAENGRAALRRLRAGAADVVVTDIVMPELDGIGLIRAAAREFPAVPFIAMSGGLASSPACLADAARSGAVACLEKPFAIAELDGAIRRALGPHARPSARMTVAAG